MGKTSEKQISEKNGVDAADKAPAAHKSKIGRYIVIAGAILIAVSSFLPFASISVLGTSFSVSIMDVSSGIVRLLPCLAGLVIAVTAFPQIYIGNIAEAVIAGGAVYGLCMQIMNKSRI